MGGSFKGVSQAAIITAGNIQIVHRTRDIKITVGVKAIHKSRALVSKVTFHLKISVKAKANGFACLQITAKFFGQSILRQIGDMGCHARDRQAFVWFAIFVIVGAAVPIRVCHHCLAANLMKRDILCCVACGTCKDNATM